MNERNQYGIYEFGWFDKYLTQLVEAQLLGEKVQIKARTSWQAQKLEVLSDYFFKLQQNCKDKDFLKLCNDVEVCEMLLNKDDIRFSSVADSYSEQTVTIARYLIENNSKLLITDSRDFLKEKVKDCIEYSRCNFKEAVEELVDIYLQARFSSVKNINTGKSNDATDIAQYIASLQLLYPRNKHNFDDVIYISDKISEIMALDTEEMVKFYSKKNKILDKVAGYYAYLQLDEKLKNNIESYPQIISLKGNEKMCEELEEKIIERAKQIYLEHQNGGYHIEGPLDEIEKQALKLAFSKDFCDEQRENGFAKRTYIKKKYQNDECVKKYDLYYGHIAKLEDRPRLEPATLDSSFEEMKEIYRKRNEEYHIKTFQRNSNKNKQM